MHDELPGAGREGAARSARHPSRADDDGARLHRRPAAARRAAQGLPARPRGRVRTSCRPRPAPPRRSGWSFRTSPAGCRDTPCACPVPTGLARRPDDRGRAPDDGRRGQRDRRGAGRPRPSWQGSSRYSEEPLVSSDIIRSPYSSIFDAGLTTVDRRHTGQGRGLVRQRVGILEPPRRARAARAGPPSQCERRRRRASAATARQRGRTARAITRSSRDGTTTTRTRDTSRETTVSPAAVWLASSSTAIPRKPSCAQTAARHVRRVLADAAREGQRVEPAEGDGHSRHGLANAVAVDAEREPRIGRAVALEPRDISCSRECCQTRLALERGFQLLVRHAIHVGDTGALPDRPEPALVAIGTPSSGVKPIVVSIERPEPP